MKRSMQHTFRGRSKWTIFNQVSDRFGEPEILPMPGVKENNILYILTWYGNTANNMY